MNSSTRIKSEVDLKVSQVIKNNQDFMYGTHQSIQNINNAIVALSLQNEKLQNKLENSVKAVQIAFENLDERVGYVLKNCTSTVGECVTDVNHLSVDVNKTLHSMRSEFISKEEFNTFCRYIECKVSAVRDFLENIIEKQKMYESNLKSKIDQSVGSESQKIRQEMPDLRPLQEYIDSKFEILRNDFGGLMKEITLVKKDTYYQQKKIENLYTLIDRLKSGI